MNYLSFARKQTTCKTKSQRDLIRYPAMSMAGYLI